MAKTRKKKHLKKSSKGRIGRFCVYQNIFQQLYHFHEYKEDKQFLGHQQVK